METLHAADSRINYQRTWTQKRSKLKVSKGKGEGGYKKRGPEIEGDIEMADVEPVWELRNRPRLSSRLVDIVSFKVQLGYFFSRVMHQKLSESS